MLKKGFLTGLLLFGMFFGAGNLIFPVEIGALSGQNLGLTVAGFILSGVGLAILALILGSLCDGGYKKEFTTKFGKVATVIFLIILYLTIGPFFAIPRTAATSYVIGIEPLIKQNELLTHYGLLIYSLVYFIAGLAISLNKDRLMDRVGKVLTPIFAILILVLVVVGSIKYADNQNISRLSEYSTKFAFGTGFKNGYNTMDALAAVVFSSIATISLKKFGFKNKIEYITTVIIVGIITAIGFSVLYLGLANLGNKYPLSIDVLNDTNIQKGSYIITYATRDLFGNLAGIFLSVMVVLTCFTTAVGLIVSISQFLYEIYDKISYKVYVVIISIFSAFITNFGLNSVIAYAVPVLVILYPAIICIILLIIINKLLPLSIKGMRITLLLVVLFAIFKLIFPNIAAILPLDNFNMSWIWAFIIGFISCFIFSDKKIGDRLN